MIARLRPFDFLLLVLALAATAWALLELERPRAGVVITPDLVAGTIPVERVELEGTPPGPVVVIAHGFSGSSLLMRSLALDLARSGLRVLAFDFPGHGRNPTLLEGDLFRIEGASARLVAATRAVLAEARRIGDGRVALLGHSMAGDVLVRTAALEPDVAAVVAISLFSPAVTAEHPRNLLVIAGAWEGRLAAEALRVVGLASAPSPPAFAVTYGRFEDGTARRAVVVPNVEHVGVLFAATTLREARAWLLAAFGRPASPLEPVTRGPWILLLIAGSLLLAREFARALPRLGPAGGARMPARRLLGALLVAVLVPPAVLRLVPFDPLPIALLDHLAAHQALLGLLVLGLARPVFAPDAPPAPRPAAAGPVRMLLVAIAAAVLVTGPVALAVGSELTALPWTTPRIGLRLLLLVGALPFFLAVERAAGMRFGPPLVLVALLLSLGVSIALDRRLLFLGALAIVILPVLATAFLVARWVRRATGRPLPAALAAAAFTAELLGGSLPSIADQPAG